MKCIIQVCRFFAMSHYHQDKVQFFYSLNPQQMKNKHQELNYSLISTCIRPHVVHNLISSVLNYYVLIVSCLTKVIIKIRMLLTLNDSNLARRALMLKRPSLPYYFEQNKQEQWRVISHLSLNNMSLMKAMLFLILKNF